MAKSSGPITASGVVKGVSGTVWAVNITKVATGAGVVRLWDNPTTNSGGKIFEGDGLSQQSFQLNDGNGGAIAATQGIYVELGGTTNATVIVIYD